MKTGTTPASLPLRIWQAGRAVVGHAVTKVVRYFRKKSGDAKVEELPPEPRFETEKAMQEINSIRSKLVEPAFTPTTLADLVQLSTIVRDVTTAEKNLSDITKEQNKSESLRFWIPVLAPTLSAIAVVATLLLQMYQFQFSSTAQRQAAEDTAWRESIRDLRATQGPGVPIALHQLRSFFDSDRYASSARAISITLLSDLTGQDAFQIVFPEILRTTTWDNFSTLGRLSRGLDGLWSYIEKELEEVDAQIASAEKKLASASPANGEQSNAQLLELRKRKRDAEGARRDVIEQLRITTHGITTFLREHAADRPARDFDFTGAAFEDGDFGGLSLDNFNLERSIIRSGSIAGASLKSCNVNYAVLLPGAWSDSRWDNTAWWRAGEISPALLEYLKNKFPFDANTAYAMDQTRDAAEYGREVSRLEERNQKAAPTGAGPASQVAPVTPR